MCLPRGWRSQKVSSDKSRRLGALRCICHIKPFKINILSQIHAQRAFACLKQSCPCREKQYHYYVIGVCLSHSALLLKSPVHILSFLFFTPYSFLLCARSLRCVYGREHHGSRGDRGGNGSYPAPARGPGAPGVRAALHVSCWFVSFLCFSNAQM